jgi:activator of HSP90 ATPase
MGDMKNEFTISETFHASAKEIYKAWLTTKGHTAMTGSPAKVDAAIKGSFTAWDGYIWGIFLEFEENKRIVQAWRTGEFPEEAEDSHVEILLEEIASTGERRLATTKVTLIHTNIPEGQAQNYMQGWEDFYFKPMKEYFG